jgi:hypothetical protein
MHDHPIGDRSGHFPDPTQLQDLIPTLLVTIIIESIIVLGFCHWRGKPVRPILLTSISINIVTQSFLWIVLTILYQSYIIPLLLSEIVIWMIESLALHAIPGNKLRLKDAMVLSLSMNLLSFTLGWFLPV